MFSLEIGRPIAIINDGLLDKEVVHIKGDNDKCCKKCSNSCPYKKNHVAEVAVCVVMM